jgi:hypothetical protein
MTATSDRSPESPDPLAARHADTQDQPMHEPSDAAGIEPFSGAETRSRRESALVRVAPGPEEPDLHDKGGRQLGMIILLGAGGVFWAAVTALLIFVLR